MVRRVWLKKSNKKKKNKFEVSKHRKKSSNCNHGSKGKPMRRMQISHKLVTIGSSLKIIS